MLKFAHGIHRSADRVAPSGRKPHMWQYFQIQQSNRVYSVLCPWCARRGRRLMPPSGELNQTALSLILPLWLHYVKTWRHPQNRKCITEDRATSATRNLCRKFCKVWSCGFWDMRTDRQTYRHAHRNTSHSCRGWNNNLWWRCLTRSWTRVHSYKSSPNQWYHKRFWTQSV